MILQRWAKIRVKQIIVIIVVSELQKHFWNAHQQRLTWCCCFCETFARFHTSGNLRCRTQSAVQMQSSSIVWYLLTWTHVSGNDSYLTLITTVHPVGPSFCGYYVRDSTLQCGALRLVRSWKYRSFSFTYFLLRRLSWPALKQNHRPLYGETRGCQKASLSRAKCAALDVCLALPLECPTWGPFDLWS